MNQILCIISCNYVYAKGSHGTHNYFVVVVRTHNQTHQPPTHCPTIISDCAERSQKPLEICSSSKHHTHSRQRNSSWECNEMPHACHWMQGKLNVGVISEFSILMLLTQRYIARVFKAVQRTFQTKIQFGGNISDIVYLLECLATLQYQLG